MIRYNEVALDFEREGRANLEVIGLRYTGPKSSVSPRRPRQVGGWPGVAPFQGGEILEENDSGRVMERAPGPLQIGLSPDWIDTSTVKGGTVERLENLTDWEVVYDPADLAQALLDANYLPAEVFGGPDRGFVKPVREALTDTLGIDNVGRLPEAEEEIKKELAEVAGVEYKTVATDDGMVSEYGEVTTRAQALEAAETLGMDTTETTPKSEALEFLTGEFEADAREALRDAGAEV